MVEQKSARDGGKTINKQTKLQKKKKNHSPTGSKYVKTVLFPLVQRSQLTLVHMVSTVSDFKAAQYTL